MRKPRNCQASNIQRALITTLETALREAKERLKTLEENENAH